MKKMVLSAILLGNIGLHATVEDYAQQLWRDVQGTFSTNPESIFEYGEKGNTSIEKADAIAFIEGWLNSAEGENSGAYQAMLLNSDFLVNYEAATFNECIKNNGKEKGALCAKAAYAMKKYHARFIDMLKVYKAQKRN